MVDSLRDDVANHITRNIGQPEVAATVTVRKLCMVDSQQIENGGVNVVDMHRLVDHLPAEIIRRTVGHSALDPATGQPHRESVGIVIAAIVRLATHEAAAHLDDGGSSKLRAANDESFVE